MLIPHGMRIANWIHKTMSFLKICVVNVRAVAISIKGHPNNIFLSRETNHFQNYLPIK